MTGNLQGRVREEQLRNRVRVLEAELAYQARVVEAQASLDTESKYIGKQSKRILTEQVEEMRKIAAGGTPLDMQSQRREYRSLVHKRRGHKHTTMGCTECYEEGLT